MEESHKKFLSSLRCLLREDQLLSKVENFHRFKQDWRGIIGKDPLCVVLPDNVEQISKVVSLCNKHGVPITPQGGNTGLCGAALPYGSSYARVSRLGLSKAQEAGKEANAGTVVAGEGLNGRETSGKGIILCMSNMNKLIDMDKENRTITVEAGMTLKNLCDMVESHDCSFPLRVAPWEKCQIGGMIGTNAGGIHTVCSGSMRNMILGLEVVLPDGRILNNQNKLRKNNFGYDLNNIFIGSEGTLGIVTSATLKLSPKFDLKGFCIPCDSFKSLIDILDICEGIGAIFSFEILSRKCIDLLYKHKLSDFDFGLFTNGSVPEWAAIVTFCFNADFSKIEKFALSDELRESAMSARLNMSGAQKLEGSSIKNDISLPISVLGEFIDKSKLVLEQHYAQHEEIVFGHLGEGNLHYNLLLSKDLAKKEGRAAAQGVSSVSNLSPLQELVIAMGGSISGEHGIGLKNKALFKKIAPVEKVAIMESIKSLLDPKNIMNPDKLL